MNDFSNQNKEHFSTKNMKFQTKKLALKLSDGESNLKQKDVIESCSDKSEIFDYILRTDQPNDDLNQFHGYIEPFNEIGQKQPVKNNNLILRGCVLRNTDSITGLVVYCGRNTKDGLQNLNLRLS